MRKIYNLFPHKPRNVRLKFPSYLKYQLKPRLRKGSRNAETSEVATFRAM